MSETSRHNIRARAGGTAVVRSEAPSAWVSCQTIVPNLQRAYESQGWTDTHVFSLSPGMSTTSIWALAQAIHRMRPRRIVFIDHKPHPGELLKALRFRFAKDVFPDLYFHVFGDFTLYSRQWRAFESELKGQRVGFICASPRQAELISRFLVEPEGAVFRCPFPVDTAEYHYSSAERTKWRKRLGIPPDDKVLLYTGRISLQKNVIRLTREIAKLRGELGFMPWFLIAGTFDDLGAPFFGLNLVSGYYFQAWNELIVSLPADTRRKIRYLGHQEPSALNGLYNASDLFTSLSVHHDEDYGMSPAEALCTGCPVVLTDWGGYSSFQDRVSEPGLDGCDLVPVSINETGLRTSSRRFAESVAARIGNEPENSKAALRSRRARAYSRQLSIERSAAELAEIYSRGSRAFSGFNWRLEKYADSLSQRVAFARGPRKNTFYEEIYGAYVN